MKLSQDNIMNKIEWACFKLDIIGEDAIFSYINPKNPQKLISYEDVDSFTNLKDAIECTEKYRLQGIISRECVEYLTYVNIESVPEQFRSKKMMDSHKNLSQIIQFSSKNPERYKIILMDKTLNGIILDGLMEAMGQRVIGNDTFTYKNINFYT